MPLIINCIRWLIAGTNDNYMSCLSETRLLTKGVGKKIILSLVVANMCSLQVTLQVSFDVDAETASRLAITRIFIHFQEKHSIYLQGTTLDRFLIW